MQCPRDGKELTSKRYEADVLVDGCSSCNGMWLDRDELEKVQESTQHDYSLRLQDISMVARMYELARQKARPRINCPKCQNPLSAEEYAYCSQILIDRCGNCGGVWFDEGEIEALEQFFEQQKEASTEVRKGFWASLFSNNP